MKWADKSLIWLMLVVMGAIALYDWWQPQPTPAPPPEVGTTLECTIAQISDGDSLTAQCPDGLIDVRFHGIDAPELGQLPWGDRSRKALQSLLREGSKTIQLTIKAIDQYERSVAIVRQGNRNIGLEMVKQGQAVVYRQYNRDANYLAAEAQAKSARLGIWASPGSQQDPAKWRRYHPR